MPRARIDVAYRKYLMSMRRIEKALTKDAREIIVRHRQAMSAMVANFGAQSPTLAIMFRREMAAMKREVMNVSQSHIAEVATIADNFFEAQKRVFDDASLFDRARVDGLERRDTTIRRMKETIADFVDASSATLISLLYTLQDGDSDEQDIINRLFDPNFSSGRASVFRHTENAMRSHTQKIIYAGAGGILGAYYAEVSKASEGKYKKQAIAAIDERTTETCLRVHGQIRDIDKPFTLTGTPRYADDIMKPPFHDYCRTAYVLYLDSFSDTMQETSKMKHAARKELEARAATGERKEIHPSHATSARR